MKEVSFVKSPPRSRRRSSKNLVDRSRYSRRHNQYRKSASKDDAPTDEQMKERSRRRLDYLHPPPSSKLTSDHSGLGHPKRNNGREHRRNDNFRETSFQNDDDHHSSNQRLATNHDTAYYSYSSSGHSADATATYTSSRPDRHFPSKEQIEETITSKADRSTSDTTCSGEEEKNQSDDDDDLADLFHLAKKLQHSKELAGTNEDLKQQLAREKKKNEDLQKERGLLRSRNRWIEQEQEALRMQIEQLQEEKEGLSCKWTREAAVAKNHVEKLQEELAQMRHQGEQLQQEKDNTAHHCDSLQKQVQQLQEEKQEADQCRQEAILQQKKDAFQAEELRQKLENLRKQGEKDLLHEQLQLQEKVETFRRNFGVGEEKEPIKSKLE